MISEDELGSENPALNQTALENRIGGMRLNELVIRQLLSYSLAEIKRTIDDPLEGGQVIDDIFLRNFGPDVTARVKTWFRGQGVVTVVCNWPREATPLPYISVIDAGHREATEGDARAVLGDFGGYGIREGEGTAVEIRVVPLHWTIQIIVGTTDENLTMYLYWIVYFILFSNKDDLIKWYDIHNAMISGQDLKYNPEFLPTLCYAKMATLEYLTFFDIPKRYHLIRSVSLTSMIDSQTDGVRTTVVVPRTD